MKQYFWPPFVSLIVFQFKLRIIYWYYLLYFVIIIYIIWEKVEYKFYMNDRTVLDHSVFNIWLELCAILARLNPLFLRLNQAIYFFSWFLHILKSNFLAVTCTQDIYTWIISGKKKILPPSLFSFFSVPVFERDEDSFRGDKLLRLSYNSKAKKFTDR